MTCIDVARCRPPDSADVTGLDVPVGPASRGRPLTMRATGGASCSQRDAPYAAKSRPWSCPVEYLPGDIACGRLSGPSLVWLSCFLPGIRLVRRACAPGRRAATWRACGRRAGRPSSRQLDRVDAPGIRKNPAFSPARRRTDAPLDSDHINARSPAMTSRLKTRRQVTSHIPHPLWIQNDLPARQSPTGGLEPGPVPDGAAPGCLPAADPGALVAGHRARGHRSLPGPPGRGSSEFRLPFAFVEG